jgi:hypothetical protein
MYVAAKSGIASLTFACAIELAELGVRANAIAPVARTRISEEVAGDLMKAPPTGFDRMNPANIAPLVVFLASPGCRFTGRVFGLIGDSLTVFDGWSISHHFDNGAEPWTVTGLSAVLADIPVQHHGQGQAIMGVDEYVMPPQVVLDALASVEGA